MRRWAAAACTAFAAALLAAAALAALPPIGGGRASAQEADCFGRPLLPGYTLAAFAGNLLMFNNGMEFGGRERGWPPSPRSRRRWRAAATARGWRAST